MVLNDRKDERMALNKKGGLGKGLGKGIDSLISNAYAVETKKKDSTADKKEPETTVKLRLVEPASSQPRLKFDEDTLTELAESIKKYGVIQPIVVDYCWRTQMESSKAGWIEGYSSHYKRL